MTEETKDSNPFCEMLCYSRENFPDVLQINSDVDNVVKMSPQKTTNTSEDFIQILDSNSNSNLGSSTSPLSSSVGQISGVNIILDENDSLIHHRETTSIINKRESKSCGKFNTIARNNDPDKYIRLSELFQSEGHVLSKTFLESVSDQIRYIRLANDKLKSNEVNSSSPQESNTEEPKSPGSNLLNTKSSSTVGENDVNINLTVSLAQMQGSTGAKVEIGKPTTLRINVPGRQVEVEVSEPLPKYPASWTSTNTNTLENVIITRPNIPVEVSRADEGCGIAELKLDSATSTPLHLDEVEEKVIVSMMSHEGDSNNNWATYFSISNALTKAYEVAEDILATFVIPPDPNVMTVEEMNSGEDKIAISVMRLMGIPQQTRHSFYHEALQEVQVLHDVSTGTINFLHNIVNWLCTGDSATKNAFVAKTRILATMQSEVEADSEVWQQFEKDISLFTDTVTKLVKGSIAGAQGIADDERHLEPTEEEKAKEESVETVSISFSTVTENKEDHHTNADVPVSDYDCNVEQGEYSYLQLANNPFLDYNNNEYTPQENPKF